VLQHIDAETRSFIICAWQHRRALNVDSDIYFPPTLRSVERIIMGDIGTLELFHRTSSLAESLNSWLRPYLQIHRGMPK
jgi:hypothetical protein